MVDEWLHATVSCGYNFCPSLNTLRPRQNGRRFADDVFKCTFLNLNVWISLKMSLKFVPKFPINNIPALVQILTWRRSGDRPLSEPVMVSLLTHICVTRPQWVKVAAGVANICWQKNPWWLITIKVIIKNASHRKKGLAWIKFQF